MWKPHSFTLASRANHNTPAAYAEQGCCKTTLEGGRASRLAPIWLLLCQTTQLQGIAIHFLTSLSSKHLSMTNLGWSHSVCEWQAKINQCAYLPKLPGSHIMQNLYWVTESIFCRGRTCCKSLHTFNPERMTLLRFYGKPDRKPCCQHPSQPGTPPGQQSSSATLWSGLCPCAVFIPCSRTSGRCACMHSDFYSNRWEKYYLTYG